MKKLITLFGVFTALSIVAPAAAAVRSLDVSDSRQDQCSSEAKAALYDSFIKHRKADQSKAYDAAKKYLACPAGEVTEAQQQIIDYLKKYSSAYESGVRRGLLELIYNEQKYAEAYQLAKDVLAKEPDNLKLLVHLGVNGYLLGPLNNQALNAQALDYARRALQLLESGQTLEDWEPLPGREVAIAYLDYTIGTLTLQTEPKTALPYLIKSAQSETPLKKSPYTYAYIAGAYETGDYATLSDEYKRDFAGKEETPESKLALANIYEITDRMIDGYARAVALAGNDPKFASVKSTWSESLATWYKFRNGSDAGMSELVANILTKPLPPLPVRRTSL
ncbi:MAG TPA: hypothetical protein VGW76_10700 [Pyrinomonadaceae bacterium]|nr:hypothetical protein [Pyrinomonadaceae bacterium]